MPLLLRRDVLTMRCVVQTISHRLTSSRHRRSGASPAFAFRAQRCLRLRSISSLNHWVVQSPVKLMVVWLSAAQRLSVHVVSYGPLSDSARTLVRVRATAMLAKLRPSVPYMIHPSIWYHRPSVRQHRVQCGVRRAEKKKKRRGTGLHADA